jgi:hypothetical protein
LLKIEGEFYTVHDTAGHEVHVHVDKTPKLDGAFKTGDKVEAQVTDESHVLSIRHANQAKELEVVHRNWASWEGWLNSCTLQSDPHPPSCLAVAYRRAIPTLHLSLFDPSGFKGKLRLDLG